MATYIRSFGEKVVFNAKDILQTRYELQQSLGRTAAGHQTWLAVDLQSQERVTLKMLAFSPQMQWEELKLFEREAQVLKSLDRSRIPRYRDYFDIDKNTGDGVPWFVLVQDYIPGSSLQELLDNGDRFTEDRIRAIATEILEILIYLHELNPPVLHRDIKPSNLILGEDNHIYLIDFGAVQAQAAVTGVTFTIVGTSGYAPLEQFWGRAIPASDLYALGATLIHLLTGVAPADLPQKDSRIYFSNRVTIQSDLLGWIEMATEIAIEKRFHSAREALDSLRSRRDRSKISTAQTPDRSTTVLTQIKTADGNIEIHIPVRGFRKFLSDRRNPVLLTIGLFILIYLLSGFFFGYQIFLVLPHIIIFLLYPIIRNTDCLQGTIVVLQKRTIVILKNHAKEKIHDLFICGKDIQDIFIYNRNNKYQVSLKAKSGNYVISRLLTRDEAAFLAQELQDWLKIAQEPSKAQTLYQKYLEQQKTKQARQSQENNKKPSKPQSFYQRYLNNKKRK